MIKFRTPLNILSGRIRYGLARFRLWIVEVSKLSPDHWRWASLAVLLSMGLVMLGMGLDFIGNLPVWLFLIALVFFVVLSLLAGLGLRFVLRVVQLVPYKYAWIFLGSLVFVIMFFGSDIKVRVLLWILLMSSAALFGGALYNISGNRWQKLSKVPKVLTVIFLVFGTGLFSFVWFFLLYPGKEAEEVKIWAMESKHLPEPLTLDDPSLPGKHTIDSLSYGWGKEKPRSKFGPEADLLTKAVDGSSFLEGWEKLGGKLRTRYWKMSADSLALNGEVWYPLGEGPFPLVLMVHGNHLDRDFSDPGYAYLGRHFASHGIIAVTVDENFLNGAWSDQFNGLKQENDCRGWLLLKHLEQWRTWNDCDSSLFFRKVDMDRIVLIGHSRGGEAVSVAACFNDLPYYPDNAREVFDFRFGIRGIAAIAPIDGQYSPGGIPTPLKDVNYFTIQGSMDGDVRSFDGLLQMRRVRFSDTAYHFAAGLYLHGANHGQFNQSWGLLDSGYPQSMFLNRRAIMPADQQEKVALVYLTAFVKESFTPDRAYLPLFRDYRYGRNWLPELVHLNQFHESTTAVLCDYEEDVDLSSGSWAVESIEGKELALWKEGRIPRKRGDQQNNGVFLGWNNEKDSVPGYYQLHLDSAGMKGLEGYSILTFLAADAQMDPGSRKDSVRAAENQEGEVLVGKEEDPVPVDFCIVLSNAAGEEFQLRLGDYLMLQPAIKARVFKSGILHDDPDSEVVLQYIALPVKDFLNEEKASIRVEEIRTVRFVFDAEKKGSVLIDQLGFTRSP